MENRGKNVLEEELYETKKSALQMFIYNAYACTQLQKNRKESEIKIF